MPVMQKLKYGTLVSLFFVVVGGTIYVEETYRKQIQARDIIELVEGVRERELILADITKTNSIVLQIATNRQTMIDLDDCIDELIPQFVNQTRIDEWVAAYPTQPTPYMWTRSELFNYLQIGDKSSRFTRVPASAITNGSAATFGAYPLQIYKTDLEERFKVLQTLIYTYSDSAWGSNKLLGAVAYTEHYNTNQGAIFGNPSTNVYLSTSQSNEMWQDVVDNAPEWFDISGDITINEQTYDLEEAQYGSGYGQSPFNSRCALISFYKKLFLYAYNDVAYYNNLKHTLWYYHYIYGGSWVSNTSRTARIEADARSISIPRTDYFYNDNALFETVGVSSNTVKASTTGYVAAGDPGNCYISIHWEWDLEPAWEEIWDEGRFWYGWRTATNSWNAYGFDWPPQSTIESCSTYAEATNRMPVIHEWTVERCKP